MGIILPCGLPSYSINKGSESQSYSSNSTNHHQLHSEPSTSSTSSLSSQPSLPTVPSLHKHNHNLSTHYCHVSTLKTSPPNSSYVSSLVLAGKSLYSASSDGHIRLWARDPDEINSNPSPPGNVVAAAGSSVKSVVVSGDKLFTAHQDHKIRVWKVNDYHDHRYYKCIATLPTFNDRFSTLFSAKNYVRVRRHKTCTWVHHVDAVSALALSHDGSLLYSASWDRSFKVWRTSDFKCLESVTNSHDDAINHLALSQDGHLYTGSADKKIKVWKMKKVDKSSSHVKHSLEATLEKHKSAVNALALSSDGSVLYSGACDRSILVWERSDGGDGDEGGVDSSGAMVVVGALRGHSKAILCLNVVSFDLVCSGSADYTVRVWKRSLDKSYACLAVLEGHTRPVKCLTAAIVNSNSSNNSEKSSSTTSYLVYSGSFDCEIKVWRIWVPNDSF